MRYSSGIFIFRKDGKLLVAHPTGSLHDWTIPKGTIEFGETLATTAVRETEEEAGLIIPKDQLESLSKVRYRSNRKILHPFVFFEDDDNSLDLINANLHCKTCRDDGSFEIDDYRWVNMEVAHDLLHESQKRSLQEISIIYNIPIGNRIKFWKISIPNITKLGKPNINSHNVWRKKVEFISGGNSIMSPSNLSWEEDGVKTKDDYFSVELACTHDQMLAIDEFSQNHYRDKITYSLTATKLIGN